MPTVELQRGSSPYSGLVPQWGPCGSLAAMEQSEARRAVEALRRELAEAQVVVTSAQRRVASLEKLVEGYLELFPGLTEPASREAGVEKAPRGQDAVLRIMESIGNKGRYWTVTAVVSALADHGWLPESRGNPANAVRTALDRLAERDERVHKGRGSKGTVVWYWQGDGYPPPRFAGDDSAPGFFSRGSESAHSGTPLPRSSPGVSNGVSADSREEAVPTHD